MKKSAKKISGKRQANREKNNTIKKSAKKKETIIKKIKGKKKDELGKEKKLRLSERKIKSLLGVGHLEELFYLLGILKDDDVNAFIKHYKELKIKSEDTKVDRIMLGARDSNELLGLLKKELIGLLNEEYDKLKQEISSERKRGADVYIEDISAMTIPLKIKMFSATAKKKDYYKVKKIIATVEKSLKLKKK